MSIRNGKSGPRKLGVIVGVGIIVGSILIGQQAAQAATTALKTAMTAAALAQVLATDAYTTAPSIVVAENTVAAIQVAGNFGARNGMPVLVSTSGTSASGVLPTLTTFGATSVVLIGSTSNWFTAAFQSQLSTAGKPVASYIQSTDVFTRWTLAAGSAANE